MQQETEKRAYTSLHTHRPDARTTRLLLRPDAALACHPPLQRPRAGAPTARPLQHAARSTRGAQRLRWHSWGEPKNHAHAAGLAAAAERRQGARAHSGAVATWWSTRRLSCAARDAARAQRSAHSTLLTHTHILHTMSVHCKGVQVPPKLGAPCRRGLL